MTLSHHDRATVIEEVEPLSLPPDPIGEVGLNGYGRALRHGQTTITATVESYLQRISLLNPVLGAYVHVDAETALETAVRLDRALATGRDPGPLLGVPIGIKDIVAVAGMPTTAGSKLGITDLIGSEGHLVGILRERGCVILGKLATSEFALGSTGINPMRGTARNPHDARAFRVPGGSSSGCGVAVAAGLCAAAVGSDTGGSIRNPAAFCGTFGHKVTAGTLPMDGMFPVSSTFDSVGLMTGSAADGAVFWRALQGGRPPDVAIGSLRIGFVEDFAAGADHTVFRSMDAALRRLRNLGANIVPVELPWLREAEAAHDAILTDELVRNLGDRLDDAMDKAGSTVAERLLAARYAPAGRHEDSLMRLRLACETARPLVASFDVLISPTKKVVAPICEADPDGQARIAMLCGGNTRAANAFSLCACSLPIRTVGSFPTGLQLMMAGGDDTRLLAIAKAIAEALEPVPGPDLVALLGLRASAECSSFEP